MFQIGPFTLYSKIPDWYLALPGGATDVDAPEEITIMRGNKKVTLSLKHERMLVKKLEDIFRLFP